MGTSVGSCIGMIDDSINVAAGIQPLLVPGNSIPSTILYTNFVIYCKLHGAGFHR